MANLIKLNSTSISQSISVAHSLTSFDLITTFDLLRMMDPESSEQQKSKQHRDTTVECRGLFTEAEILWMTRHEIDNVRSATKQSLLVGKTRITLFQGQSIGKLININNMNWSKIFLFTVEKFHHKKLIEKIYPLHDQEKLKRLGRDWYGGADNVMSKTFQPQPLFHLFFIRFN